MKNMVGLVLTSVGIWSASVSAAPVWGVRELKIAQDVGLETFRTNHGEALYNAITGFSIERSAGGTSGRVKLNYKEGDQPKTASYFCHVHEGTDIDCH